MPILLGLRAAAATSRAGQDLIATLPPYPELQRPRLLINLKPVHAVPGQSKILVKFPFRQPCESSLPVHIPAQGLGFNDRNWLDGDKGHPLSDALHVTEHFRRTDFGHLEIQVTLDDPKAFTKLWTIKQSLNLLPDTELLENVCENERDTEHLVGK